MSVISKILRFVSFGKAITVNKGADNRLAQDGASTPGPDLSNQSALSEEHELQHRALVYLMTQKTDSVLDALAKTIEKERLKLGMEKMRVFDVDPVHFKNVPMEKEADRERPDVAQILSMASEGDTISKIARQLVLPENEISMVLRLNQMGM